MNRAVIIRGLKANWHLVAAFGVLVAVGLVASVWTGDSQQAEALARQQSTLTDAELSKLKAASQDGLFKPAPTRRQETLKTIETYKQKIKTNPTSAETALNLRRVANLYYTVLHDYEQAIQYYEMFMIQFPNHERIGEIYPMLAACYKETGQFGLERQTYRRMLDYFPPDSQYYLYAQQQLTPDF